MRDITSNASQGLFYPTHGGIAGTGPPTCLEGTRVNYDEVEGDMHLSIMLRIAICLRGFEGRKPVSGPHCWTRLINREQWDMA